MPAQALVDGERPLEDRRERRERLRVGVVQRARAAAGSPSGRSAGPCSRLPAAAPAGSATGWRVASRSGVTANVAGGVGDHRSRSRHLERALGQRLVALALDRHGPPSAHQMSVSEPPSTPIVVSSATPAAVAVPTRHLPPAQDTLPTITGTTTREDAELAHQRAHVPDGSRSSWTRPVVGRSGRAAPGPPPAAGRRRAAARPSSRPPPARRSSAVEVTRERRGSRRRRPRGRSRAERRGRPRGDQPDGGAAGAAPARRATSASGVSSAASSRSCASPSRSRSLPRSHPAIDSIRVRAPARTTTAPSTDRARRRPTPRPSTIATPTAIRQRPRRRAATAGAGRRHQHRDADGPAQQHQAGAHDHQHAAATTARPGQSSAPVRGRRHARSMRTRSPDSPTAAPNSLRCRSLCGRLAT